MDDLQPGVLKQFHHSVAVEFKVQMVAVHHDLPEDIVDHGVAFRRNHELPQLLQIADGLHQHLPADAAVLLGEVQAPVDLRQQGRRLQHPGKFLQHQRFELGGGEKLVLEQAREDISRVVVYPTLAQARKMIAKGIRAVTYTLDSGAVTDTFSGPSFTDAFSKGYQTVMSVAER